MEKTKTRFLVKGSGLEPSAIYTRDGYLAGDVLGGTEHYKRYKEDLRLVQEHGIKYLRVAIPWHRICRIRGQYDWNWITEYVEYLLSLGIIPIFDPLHHTSFPAWLKGGFLDDDFVDEYKTFFRKIMKRFPQVQYYTIVNEPLVTNVFCTRFGREHGWYPFAASDEAFFKGLQNLAIIIRDLSLELKEAGKIHVYVDATHVTHAGDEESAEYAKKLNSESFQLLELLFGRIKPGHELYDYFKRWWSESFLEDFVLHPANIDILGCDFYSHCERDRSKNGETDCKKPFGMAKVLFEYGKRYRKPIMLTETNARGFITDRYSWFYITARVYLRLKKMLKRIGVELLGYFWYPFIDSTDWDDLIRQFRRHIDAVGLIFLDKNFNRQTNELSETVKKLNSGEWCVEDMPAPYKFLYPVYKDRFIGYDNPKWRDALPAVVVTGSSNGIGKELAIDFARLRYPVVITYNHNRNAGLETLRRCKAFGATAILRKLDVSNSTSIKSFVKSVTTWGRKKGIYLDTLVHNAAVIEKKPLAEQTDESIIQQVATNLAGPIFLTKYLALHVRKIVCIGSDVAYNAIAGMTTYSATKAGITHFARTIALEHSEREIVCIHPDKTATQMNDAEGRDPAFVAKVIRKVITSSIGKESFTVSEENYSEIKLDDYFNYFDDSEESKRKEELESLEFY